jgi:methylase of polypeptide subunit release factors
MRFHMHGHSLELAYTEAVKPTPFSLFLANAMELRSSDLRSCDLGTGSGILAIALALMGAERVVAVDRCADACALALENAERNGVANRIEFVTAELAEFDCGGDFDLVVANPPTMPAAAETPDYAVGPTTAGLGFVDLLVAGLPGWLGDSGRAQLVLSSLVLEEILSDLRSAALDCRPLASMLVPFRDFYLTAYGPDQLEEFVVEGRALRDGPPVSGELSELITVYEVACPGPAADQ